MPGGARPQPDGRQRWREEAIQALLATEDTVFVAGREENQVEFHSQFDHIILSQARMNCQGWVPERESVRRSGAAG